MNWKESANQAAILTTLRPIDTQLHPPPNLEDPAIDQFYDTCRTLVMLSTPQNLQQYDYLGQLVFLGIVAATENYFRTIFSEIIEVCAVSKDKASEKQMSYASAVWHQPYAISRGLFDAQSLAGGDKIKSAAEQYCGIKIDEKYKEYIAEFNKVSELRHCVAHVSGIVVGKNASELDVGNQTRIRAFHPDAQFIQDSIATCRNIVLIFNSIAFEQIVMRWAKTWKPGPTWDWSQDREKFKTIFNLFHSKLDHQAQVLTGYANPYHCYRAIKKDLKIP